MAATGAGIGALAPASLAPLHDGAEALWPGLRGTGVLEALLRRPGAVTGLWPTTGHLFVAHGASPPAPRAAATGGLVAFDQVPRSRVLSTSHEDALDAAVARGVAAPAELPVLCLPCASPVALVVPDGATQGQFLSIHENGTVDILVYDRLSHRWAAPRTDAFRLTPPANGAADTLADIVYCDRRQQFAWLQRQGDHYKLCLRRVATADPDRVEVFPLQVVLTGIPARHGPATAFGLCGETVFLAPRHSPTASRLLLTWNLGGAAALGVHLWGHGDLAARPQHRESGRLRAGAGIVPCYSYDAVRQSVLAAAVDLRAAPSLLAVGAHPATGELVVLDSCLAVHAVRRASSGPQLHVSHMHHRLVRADEADGSRPCPLVGPARLVVTHHFLTVAHATATEVFSLLTGTMAASMPCDGAQPHRVWSSGSDAATPQAGIWAAGGGAWCVSASKVSQQASWLQAQSQASSILDTIRLCDFYMMDRLAAQHSLKAATPLIVQAHGATRPAGLPGPHATDGAAGSTGSTGKDAARPSAAGLPLQQMSMDEVQLLVRRLRAVLQNPALVLTVLATRPDALDLLQREVREYLASDRPGQPGSEAYETVDDAVLADSFLRHTPMNQSLQGTLRSFSTDVENYVARFAGDAGEEGCGTASTTEATRRAVRLLLEQAEAETTTAGTSDWSRSQLEAYVRRLPHDVLACILEFIQVDLETAASPGPEDHNEPAVAVTARSNGPAPSPDRSAMLSGERVLADAAMGDALRRSAVHPLFEITCRLLYRLRPAALKPFIAFTAELKSKQTTFQAAGTSNESLFTHYCRRAIQALPDYLGEEETPTSEASILAHVDLLTNKAAVEHIELFHTLTAALLRDGELAPRNDAVWALRPALFGSNDMLRVFHEHYAHADSADTGMGASTAPVLCTKPGTLTLADVKPHLKQLLQQGSPLMHGPASAHRKLSTSEGQPAP